MKTIEEVVVKHVPPPAQPSVAVEQLVEDERAICRRAILDYVRQPEVLVLDRPIRLQRAPRENGRSCNHDNLEIVVEKGKLQIRCAYFTIGLCDFRYEQYVSPPPRTLTGENFAPADAVEVGEALAQD